MKPTKSPEIHTLERLVSLDAPKPEDILIEDIAWSLANNPRFNGHTRWRGHRRFYSVAEHSVLVSLAPGLPTHKAYPKIHAWALLHDAFEGYAHDIIRPLKNAMLTAAYNDWEIKFFHALAKKFSLGTVCTVANNSFLRQIDDELLDLEIALLTNITPTPRRPPNIGYGNIWLERPPLTADEAFQAFMERARELRLSSPEPSGRTTTHVPQRWLAPGGFEGE